MIPEEINGLVDLRPGDIGFGPIHGDIGIGIRMALAFIDGGAPYQHTFIVTEAASIAYDPTTHMATDMTHPPYAVEAQPGGAVEIAIDERWTKDYCYVRPNYNFALDQAARAAATAKSLIGTPYSYLDYYAIGVHHLPVLKKFNKLIGWIDRYITSSKHMICSQLVDYCLAQAGWHAFDDGRLSQDVTPSALYYKLDTWKPRLIFAYP